MLNINRLWKNLVEKKEIQSLFAFQKILTDVDNIFKINTCYFTQNSY